MTDGDARDEDDVDCWRVRPGGVGWGGGRLKQWSKEILKAVAYPFKADVDFRRLAKYLIAGLLLPPALALVISVALEANHGSLRRILLTSSAMWVGIFLAGAGKVLGRVLFAPQSSISISSDGVMIDGRSWGWAQVVSVRTRSFCGKRWLYVVVKSSSGRTVVHALPGTQCLDSSGFDALRSAMINSIRHAAKPGATESSTDTA